MTKCGALPKIEMVKSTAGLKWGQCPHLPFWERGLSPIRSAWPGNTLGIVKPLVLAERCELGQLALRANEDTTQNGGSWTRFPVRSLVTNRMNSATDQYQSVSDFGQRTAQAGRNLVPGNICPPPQFLPPAFTISAFSGIFAPWRLGVRPVF